jgi:predicted DNA binding CopG/RHH family protein
LPVGTRSFTSSSDDGLEDDIATLSYERALRAHGRYRSTIQPLTHVSDLKPVEADDSPPAAPAAATQPAGGRIADSEPDANRVRSTQFERNLKSASITIRLSRAECAQLHRRAGDAGLTVSAYLRSCTFEAESLRAMVKDTLAELRLAKAQSKPPEPEPPRRSGFEKVAAWLVRLLTPWHSGQRTARA